MNASECASHCTFAQFFSNSREAMFITHRDGYFIDINTAMLDLLGYRRQELIGNQVALTLDKTSDREDYQQTIERDGVVHDYALTLRRKDGSLLLGMIDAVVWREHDRIAGYHGIIRTRQAITESFMIHLNRLREEQRQLREERRNLVSDTQLLTRYLNEDLLAHIQRTGTNPLENGRHRATILFFDIRASTGIAERAGPEEFATFLSDILTDIMDLIYGCKGSVNKLLGDGLMATFGVPLSTGEDALNAVEAAQRIQEYLRTFNDVRPDFLPEPVAAGIGVATGSVFAGVIGSVRRQEYTVLGDPVNIASRLEGLTKTRGEAILIDHETYLSVRQRIPCRPLFRAILRGREEPLRVFGV